MIDCYFHQLEILFLVKHFLDILGQIREVSEIILYYKKRMRELYKLRCFSLEIVFLGGQHYASRHMTFISMSNCDEVRADDVKNLCLKWREERPCR